MTQTLQAIVSARRSETEAIATFELRAQGGGELPPFTAGAHVDLYLPNGLVRSYSLINGQDERDRYVIGVSRDAASRGGSRYVHEHVQAGTVLTIGHPRNNFELDENAPRSVFVAGGIGITPILSMTRRLEVLGRAWTLHYCTRTRAHAAFLDYLGAPGAFRHGEVMRSPPAPQPAPTCTAADRRRCSPHSSAPCSAAPIVSATSSISPIRRPPRSTEGMKSCLPRRSAA
jgi:ferredoxin-NADP reductase